MAPVLYHEDKFPPSKLDWDKLIKLVGQANGALARFDGALSATPNVQLLITPLITREAVLSSRIEGTQASLSEVFEFEGGSERGRFSNEKLVDIQEIINYRRALGHALNMLESLPLCQRVLAETHKALMNSVRGHGKAPGQYRKIPNWIGPPGSTIEQARFIPIPSNKLPKAMDRWERYLHSETQDKLVQLAILHAEFEALHPFLDGNGRLGRLLVPLFLYKTDLIRRPTFYISAFFEAHRDRYYDQLLAVSSEDNWTGWCVFFLEAVKAQAEENLHKVQAILELYEEMKMKTPQLTGSKYAIKAVDWIFHKPVFTTTDFTSSSGIPKSSALRVLEILRNNGILKVSKPARGRIPAVLYFPKLLRTIEEPGLF